MRKPKFDITLDEVYAAYIDCRRHKRKTTNQLKFELSLEDNLLLLWEELRYGTYEIGRSLTFLVTRPKLREVFAANFRDRIVHHLIMLKLQPLFEEEFIPDTYNCRVGKGTLYGVKRLQLQIKECEEKHPGKQCWIMKFDFSGFFMSIHKPTLWKKLRSFIEEKYKGKDMGFLLWIVKKVIFHCPQNNCYDKSSKHLRKLLAKNKSLFYVGEDNGLPIGNLTSLLFANFYLSDFDHMMLSLFHFYGRYVDDFSL